jgi:tetratricopeptide (TPR) repeat protein
VKRSRNKGLTIRRSTDLTRQLIRTSSDHAATQRELALQCLRHDPDHAQVWSILAGALVDLRDFRGARTALRRLEPLSRGESRYWLFVRRSLYCDALGQLREAERWARKAAAISLAAQVFLGATLAKQGRFAEAKACHRRAARAPDDPRLARDEAFYNLGLIFRAERRYAAAMKAFDRAVEIDPNYALAIQDRDDVRAAMRVVVPTERRDHWRLLMQTMGSQAATGHEVARAYVRRYPAHFGGWLALASILANFARYPEAFAAVETAARVAITEEWRESPAGAFFTAWGDVWKAKMDFRRAETLYRKAVRRRGSRAQLYRVWLADVVVKQGRFSEAARLFRRSLASSPKDPSMIHYLLGLIARSRREYREAVKHFDRALAHDRGYRTARVARRDALKAMTVRRKRQ